MSINVRTLPCGFRFAMSGTLPPILLKSSMENSTSDLSNKTNIISCAIDTKSKVTLSRRRETRIRAHLHDTKVVPTSSLTVASYFCSSWRRISEVCFMHLSMCSILIGQLEPPSEYAGVKICIKLFTKTRGYIDR